MEQRNIITPMVLGILIVFGFAVPIQNTKSASIEYPISIFCLPDKAKADIVGAFVQSQGEALTVHCDISSSDKDKERSVFLLGKQVFEGQDLATTGSTVVLKGNETANVSLVFPAVFQGGEYQYTFSLQEGDSGQLLAHDAYLIGSVELNKTEVKIINATMDRNQYAWQDNFQLTVHFEWPKSTETKEALFLHISLDDVNGNECAVLVEKHAVTSSTETMSAAFPVEGVCANQMTLSLRGSDNNIIDQKVIAVGLPEKKSITEQKNGEYFQVFGRVPRPLLAFLVLTGIVVLGLGGSVLMRRKSL